jgi:hypothetical protein
MADRLRLRALLASICMLVWLVTPAATGATHLGEGVPDEVTLQVSFQQAPVAGAHAQLVARALIDDGSPVTGVEVEFLREMDFLGPRLISLGSSTTDSSGTARVTIDINDPTIVVRARFKGNEQYSSAEVTSEVHQAAAPNGPTTGAGGGEPNLAVVAAVMPPLLALMALVIWLALLGLTAVTVIRIRRDRTTPVPARKERTTG